MGLSRMLLGLIIVCGLLSIVYGVYTINSLMSADAGDGGVLAPQIGLRPFRHRAGNLLHAR